MSLFPQKHAPDDNKVKAVGCGAIEAIVNVMTKNISETDVCRNGCIALGNITANSKLLSNVVFK